MTELRIASRLHYEIHAPTSFAFSIVAARTAFQSVTSEQIDIRGDDEVSWHLVPYGAGTHQLVRATIEPGSLHVDYEASVTVNPGTALPEDLEEAAFDEIPADVLPYLNPSRYCESDKLGAFAARHFGDVDRGFERVQAISDWVTENLIYESGSTNGSSSTTDVLLQRAGVCRDFAHVAIALCRAVGIPARYVSGYGIGVEPQDFHGFFEAYLGGDWYLFDPTAMAMANALVRIGYGRDAADAPFATLVGQATLIDKNIDVETVGSVPEEPAAASTA